MKLRQSTIASFALLFFGLACGKEKYTVLIKDAETTYYQKKDPKLASQKLIPHVNEEDEDQLLFMYEAGMLLHHAKQFETSNKILLDADKRAENLATSITGEISSYLINERGKPYKGEDYERVMVNMVLGLNFLQLGKYDDALVEFKRVNIKLNSIKKRTKNLYKVNLMAKYLAAFSAQLAQEYEYGYVELKQIHKINSKIDLVGAQLMRFAKIQKYADDYAKWKSKYTKVKIEKNFQSKIPVMLVHESGKAPIKVSRGKLLEESGMLVTLREAIHLAITGKSTAGITVVAAIAALAMAEHPIPKYIKRDATISSIRLTLKQNNNKHVFKSHTLNSIEDTMIKNFEDHYTSIKSKMVKRIAAKVVASLMAQKAAKATAKALKADGVLTSLISFAAGAAVGFATLAFEKPDLRCWHTLPKSYATDLKYIKPGKYNMKVSYYDKGGNLVEENSRDVVELKKGQPFIYVDRTTD